MMWVSASSGFGRQPGSRCGVFPLYRTGRPLPLPVLGLWLRLALLGG